MTTKEIKLPYEIVKKAVDAAADLSNPGVWVCFNIWMNDGTDYEISIERPKNLAKPTPDQQEGAVDEVCRCAAMGKSRCLVHR